MIHTRIQLARKRELSLMEAAGYCLIWVGIVMFAAGFLI